MPLIEKEIVRPGTYWYRDEKTGEALFLTVTPELTRYWHEQGSKMLSNGLTVPVPYEHDFNAHPMTPAEKLLNNAGWMKEYRVKSITDPKTNKKIDNVLFGVVDIQDDDVAKKLPRTIRWSSPWISSFTDGQGKQWNNVIAHLALTTRPRITEQQPFPSIAAALSLATETKATDAAKDGFCLSRAGLLSIGNNRDPLPMYPLAFSLYAGSVSLDMTPPKKKSSSTEIDSKKPEKPTSELRKTDSNHTPAEKKSAATPPIPAKHERSGVPDGDEDEDDDLTDDILQDDDPNQTPQTPDNDNDLGGITNPMQDANSDVGMEELLCDLLQALGVPMPDGENTSPEEFKRHLYEAAMGKIKELAAKHQQTQQQPPPVQPPQAKPNVNPPKPSKAAPSNPLIQQEQQPMYMSLESSMASLSLDDIHKIEDSTMRTFALSMYTEMEQLRAESAANKAKTEAMQNAELQKQTQKRQQRVALLSRLSPKVKEDLEGMLSLQSMALSMDQSGNVVDPMKQTLDMLEKGLANMPRLLTADSASLAVHAHPTDADQLSAEGEAALVDSFSRMMGATPEKQAS